MRKLSNNGSTERSDPHSVTQSHRVQATGQHVQIDKAGCTRSQFVCLFVWLLDNFSLCFLNWQMTHSVDHYIKVFHRLRTNHFFKNKAQEKLARLNHCDHSFSEDGERERDQGHLSFQPSSACLLALWESRLTGLLPPIYKMRWLRLDICSHRPPKSQQAEAAGSLLNLTSLLTCQDVRWGAKSTFYLLLKTLSPPKFVCML